MVLNCNFAFGLAEEEDGADVSVRVEDMSDPKKKPKFEDTNS